MNVTKHARERWIERAKPESTDQAEEQVIEAFEKSFFVWTDKFEMSYYIAFIDSNYWIFVVDEKKDAIITVYSVDYGFPPDINADVARKLWARIGEAEAKAKEEKEENDRVRAELLTEKDLVLVEIEKMESELEKLKARVRKIDAEVEELNRSDEAMRKEVEGLCYQLTCSRNYKMDKLAGRI